MNLIYSKSDCDFFKKSVQNADVELKLKQEIEFLYMKKQKKA